jgi:hypothetical protein
MTLLTTIVRAMRPVLLAGALACTLSGLAADSARLEARQIGDTQVKAAFLFNLAKFVQWPTDAAEPMVIGIAGDKAFADVVAQTVFGRKVNGRNLETRRLSGGDDPSGCDIVFIADMRSHDEDEWLQRVRGPALTVGESTRFLRNGGMVRLYAEGQKIRFQVNQKNTETAGLKLSSQLLTLAAK